MSFPPLIRALLKKVSPYFLISGILLFYVWLTLTASQTPLPDPKKPILLYSNQTRQDIKLTYCKALKSARESIFLSIYGISDPQILRLLCKKSKENVAIKVEYDPSASVNLKKILPSSIKSSAMKTKGLMHRKIAVLDHSQIFLGSANMTTTSLRHHANLVLGLYSPPLASYLENPSASSFLFEIGTQTGELFLLPDPKNQGLERLIQEINLAKEKINIAMFTLTHPALANALIRAKNRGIDVRIAVDYYTAMGASKKALAAMGKEGVNIYLSQGRELLHHKWAIIDNKTLIMGSANWTKAAFSKNHDFLLFLSPLGKDQKKSLSNLWKIIEQESKVQDIGK